MWVCARRQAPEVSIVGLWWWVAHVLSFWSISPEMNVRIFETFGEQHWKETKETWKLQARKAQRGPHGIAGQGTLDVSAVHWFPWFEIYGFMPTISAEGCWRPKSSNTDGSWAHDLWFALQVYRSVMIQNAWGFSDGGMQWHYYAIRFCWPYVCLLQFSNYSISSKLHLNLSFFLKSKPSTSLSRILIASHGAATSGFSGNDLEAIWFSREHCEHCIGPYWINCIG